MNRKIMIMLAALFSPIFLLAGVRFPLSRTSPQAAIYVVKATASSFATAKKRNRELRRQMASLSSKDTHVIVDTALNKLYLKKGSRILREVVVSTGSGNILEDPSGKRTWIFDTPQGVYSVKSKLTNPIWIKPDWAFIEEGTDIPKNSSDRIETGVLGDYALGFGQGYFIHGTLYTRLLGRNVTHGCIRVGDEDLKALYKTVPVGGAVIIF